MSEEILKALTQLFAIITKQDSGATVKERNYVIQFFRQELDLDSVQGYLALYDELAGYGVEDTSGSRLTSVKDSVKTLAICKKINKTLTQKQKVIVLIRLLELVNSDKNFTPQRMSIIDTVSTVFNIVKEEYSLIESVVLKDNLLDIVSDVKLLVAREDALPSEHSHSKYLHLDHFSGELYFIHIASVDMYFVKYAGHEDLLLNGLPIKPLQIYLFSHGSTLKLAHSSPLYYSDVAGIFLNTAKANKLSFHAKNLEYRFSSGTIGLRDINLAAGPGNLIGIMGGSGAGKTTLLNVLAGIETPSKGEVLINGINIHAQKDQIQGVIGYVAQDDLLIEELTVYENLYYNAKLCFANLNEEQLHQAVMSVLASLGLDHIKDIKVGNVLNKKISGGQRKRLNIALELIREPAVMFVDEPTSGLSSRDSENVIDLLKELSLKGKLIFVVIHQPSSDIYKMFDKLFLLDTGGFPIYYGNPVEAVTYFKRATNQVDSERGQCHTCGNVNPEQIFNIIEAKVVDEYGRYTSKRKVTPAQWNDKYLTNFMMDEVTTITELPPKALNLPSRIKQATIFTIRDFLSKVSNVQYMLINLLQAPLLACLLAFVIRYTNTSETADYSYRYNDNIPAFILMSVLVALFMGLTVSAEEIIRDRKIQKRESFLNLSRTSYLTSKVLILFTLSAIQTLTFVVVGHWILDIQGMTFSYWLILFTLSCFANVLGLNMSASFDSAVTVYITIPLLLIPQMIFSGIIFSFDKLNEAVSSKDKVPVLADVIAARWGFEALAVDQFKNNAYQESFYDLEKEESQAYFKYTYLVPELENRLSFVTENFSAKEDSVKSLAERDLMILERALMKEPGVETLQLDALTLDKFSKEKSVKLSAFIKQVKETNIEQFNKARDIKDQFIAYKEKNKTFNLTSYKNQFYNESLADLMKNTSAKDRIVEYNGKLLQQTDPVFRDPEVLSMLDYRTHFLAPQKPLFGRLFDTYYFNIIILWALTGFLYVTLYFEAFRKLFYIFGNIRLPKAVLTSLEGIKKKLSGIRVKVKLDIPFAKKKVATN
ncbi:ATP-binding cassette domain-containing protein [Cytophagaceae bacterium DM2B3-1]|uniref:ATP-binding cassette domain-containing protein n=1 Tax=Xanthocytophaga flava TaxID=3048013 RepID=A0ABT7CD33_9BACT|nr:ATP-binding cassette domain-containing protein [Xanthocytophaga flavus]MDJ1491575.1 ATP-binding cassette domain-containing protein [Xanthocytophaga flavus]